MTRGDRDPRQGVITWDIEEFAWLRGRPVRARRYLKRQASRARRRNDRMTISQDRPE